MKQDEFILDTYHQLNILPTYDNMLNAYNDFALPSPKPILLQHKKEQMVFMIINMVRS